MSSSLVLYNVALHLLSAMNYGNCLLPLKINPYEQIFQRLLREPPLNKNNFNRDNDEIKEEWLEQPLDHFDVNNTETWLMRYLINDNFHRPGAPVFVFVGGEWQILPQMLQSGHFYDMARQQEALMFYTEHRFYGQSRPKNDTSSQNLRFLNILQSLEDLKSFLALKLTTRALKNSKVVLVGGSYSGSMVAWFMKLYPQLATVAWASSAPLIAKMDFIEYMSLTLKAIHQKGTITCGLKLEQAFNGLRNLMQTEKAYSVVQRLKMCNSFDVKNSLNIQAFFNGLGNHFASLVQSYSSLIPEFCLSFTKVDLSPTEALLKYLTRLFLSSAQLKVRDEEDYCLDFSYEGMKSIFTNVNEFGTGTRPWFYQTCHEFGWFTTTNTSTTATNSSSSFAEQTSAYTTFPLAFGGQVSLTYFRQLCQDVFNDNNSSAEILAPNKEPPLTLEQLHNRALAINKLFGGFSNISTRVIFTHGLLDPWRAAGLQYGQNVLVIKDYSHVEDMGSINFSDTVEMNVAKLKVAAFINRNLRLS